MPATMQTDRKRSSALLGFALGLAAGLLLADGRRADGRRRLARSVPAQADAQR
jgi:hypothetical protein